ncbi:MAG: hypothetical protein QOD57_5097 [Actinomycetota bacterium]|nr:hypothetical protein [Actinomycetota bacterium]MDQ1507370.1 hypothetical protein [Actinomycetota bacterium]
MSAEAAEALASALAAVKKDLAWIYTTWSLQGPTLEACTALTAMAQEEAGHARALLGVAGIERRDHGIPCLETMPETWPELVGTAGMVELAVIDVVRALRDGANPSLSARTAKMTVEEGFHANLFHGWFPILAADARAVSERFAAAVRRTVPEIEKWLGGLDDLAVEAGVAAPGELLAAATPAPVETGPPA